MDLITQGIFGAVVGAAVGGRRLGWRAPLAGLIGGLLPDSDVLWSQGPGVEHWAFHRHITHSLWFGPVVGSLLAWLTLAWHRWRHGEPETSLRRAWFRVWILALLTHPLLDTFTHYGTQLLAPFTDLRFAIPAVPIIDPLYSATLLLALMIGLFTGYADRPDGTRRAGSRLAQGALAITTIYLLVAALQAPRAEAIARAQLESAGLAPQRIDAYPTMFTPWLRRVVVALPDTADGSQVWKIGFLSTLSPRPVNWQTVTVGPGEREALMQALATESGRRFRRFATGALFVSLEPRADGGRELRVADGRYGLPNMGLTGFWGLSWTVDPAGRVKDDAIRFRVEREVTREALTAFRDATMGRPAPGY
jgi:inner membrane protein